MKKIIISDMTLKLEGLKAESTLSFKERIELARNFDKMQADVIEFPAIENERTDALLIKTVAPFINHAVISVDAGKTKEQAALAVSALKNAKKARVSVSLPVSPVQMEYVCHKKSGPMLEYVKEMISACNESGIEIEFVALDATRAEAPFLKQVIETAADCGAKYITLCDTEGLMLPEEASQFIEATVNSVERQVIWGFEARDNIKMAQACVFAAVSKGVTVIKTACMKDYLTTESIAQLIRAKGMQAGIECNINYTVINRIASQINWILSGEKAQAQPEKQITDESFKLTAKDDIATVINEVRRLGYELTEEDNAKVFEAFSVLSTKKDVGVSELEAIVASTALQVPPTYKVKSYVINSGNIIKATANIQLEKEGRLISGLCAGDGPIDSAFKAIEQIIGTHYELDDFQIQSVTRGREAMGSALVRLRSNGKLYSGNGISTDIIGASIRAYVNALNKIVYEETVR